MSNNKLHPIYTALDSHQYQRAVKLCLALPPSHLLGQALLAHSYAKAQQRLASLQTIQRLLMIHVTASSDSNEQPTYFPELQNEVQIATDIAALTQKALNGNNSGVSSTAVASVSSNLTGGATMIASVNAANKKSGKKGKKGTAVASSSTSSNTHSNTVEFVPTTSTSGYDWVDALDKHPKYTLPDNWAELPPSNLKFLSDSTLLATVSLTLLRTLKLPLTAYQLYAWACKSINTSSGSNSSADAQLSRDVLQHALIHGLAVVVAPQYELMTEAVFKQLQPLSLQLARFDTQKAWAAQFTLWQYKSSIDAKSDPRRSVWPRLASSLALKAVQADVLQLQQQVASPELVHKSKENFLLYIETLRIQQDWGVILQIVQERLRMSGEKLAPPRQTLLELQVEALEKSEQYIKALDTLEEKLLPNHPDQWTYWKQHITFTLLAYDNDTSKLSQTSDFAKHIAGRLSTSKYIVRGPRLVQLEVAAEILRDKPSSNDALLGLADAIIQYSSLTGSRLMCTFSDVRDYVKLLVERCKDSDSGSVLEKLLVWIESFRVEPTSKDTTTRETQLRQYIFSTQMLFLVISMRPDLKASRLPPWQDMMNVWKSTKSEDQVDQAQKESRPVDELISLTVQQILASDSVGESEHFLAATLLEGALEYSPYNAYLKIFAMFVYSKLDAVSRSWELYQDLYVKHIQNESCNYLILPLLQKGGLYTEVVTICQEILRLQTTASREVIDYTGRAMEHDTLSKADEFMTFHRQKMNKSLTTLEAKGLVLHYAPLYKPGKDSTSIGAVHGIVGLDSDIDRVHTMISEAHNPYSAFSVLQLNGKVEDHIEQYSDNRDLTIMAGEILSKHTFESKRSILDISFRRSILYNLLIRAALCVDCSKGVRKGRALRTSEELKRRCQSLNAMVDDAKMYKSNNKAKQAFNLTAMHLVTNLCNIIAVISSGYDSKSNFYDCDLKDRESMTAKLLKETQKMLNEFKNECSASSFGDVSTIISEWLVPIFALFRMCGKVLDLFGCGKRKVTIKECSEDMAKAAVAFTDIISSFQAIVESRKDTSMLKLPTDVSKTTTINPDTVSRTLLTAKICRLKSIQRLSSVLDEIAEYLRDYE